MAKADEHGHIKISRKAFKAKDDGGDKLWNKRRVFSEWEAWVYLIQAAAWKDHAITLRDGNSLMLKRGETPPLAVRFLLRAWSWKSTDKVHRFLNWLKDDERVVVGQLSDDGTTYRIVKYDTYQVSKNGSRTQVERNQNETEAVRKQVESKTDSWSARAVQLWIDRFGHCNIAGRIGKALKPLIAVYEVEDVLRRFEGYLASKQPEFASPEDFANKYNTWADNKAKKAAVVGSAEEVKRLLRSGGSMIFNAYGRDQAFELMRERHPELWLKLQAVMRQLNYVSIKRCGENDYALKQDIESQLAEIAQRTAA